MLLTCPACRKQNENGDDSCARCGCDLISLRGIVHAAAHELAGAASALRQGRWTDALRHAERSWSLCHTGESARFAFLAATALGETARAVGWHRRARRDATSELPDSE